MSPNAETSCLEELAHPVVHDEHELHTNLESQKKCLKSVIGIVEVYKNVSKLLIDVYV
jgi:hypothetical protein